MSAREEEHDRCIEEPAIHVNGLRTLRLMRLDGRDQILRRQGRLFAVELESLRGETDVPPEHDSQQGRECGPQEAFAIQPQDGFSP